MKVLFILHQTYSCGGANKSFLSLAKAVMEKGVEVHVALPDKEGIYSDVVASGFHTIVTNFKYGTYPDCNDLTGALLFFPRLVARRIVLRTAVKNLSEYVIANGIDIIHSNTSVLDVGCYVSKVTQRPHITHIREYGDVDFGYQYYPDWSRFHHHFDNHLQYSICITKDIQRHHGQSGNDRSVVIYNGVCNVTSFKEHVPDKRFFLYVGRIQETKGLYDLIEAYHKYINSYSGDIPLKVIGKVADNLYQQKIQRFIEKNSLSGRIEFLGERQDVSLFMQSATAMIVPSKSEGFGRCMVEAMFNGCIVIGRNTAGTKEQFDNGMESTQREIGIRYNDVDELSQALHAAATMDEDAKLMMKRNALKVVNQLYSIEQSSANVISFYKKILQ